MTNINYKRGYNLEYKAKQILTENDFLAFRSPGSKSESDLYAFKGSTKLFIQCKKTTGDSMYIYKLDDLKSKAKTHQAIPLLVYSFNRTPVYATLVKAEKIALKKSDSNTPLKDILEVFAKP
ncbi:MAG: hypothetical protein J4432_00825 [DPANN group archaeon]|nr:hypothetical protein [DPANN group archaeon]